jgi:hypothetical protein
VRSGQGGLRVLEIYLKSGGVSAVLSGAMISMSILIPGGLCELALAFWLLIKGFQPEAYARGFQPEAYGGHAEVGHAEVRS